MEGQPAQFESIGSRLGFHILEDNNRWLKLAWQGPRFPAFLCLGMALLLLFVSVPIVLALRLRGFAGPAGALWYFPIMNLVLLVISLYLITQRRAILIDSTARQVTLTRRSLHRINALSLSYHEIEKLELALDQVYSGFSVAGSTAGQSFPAPSLRLITTGGQSILIDRGNRTKLTELGRKISERLIKPLTIDPAVAIRPEARRHSRGAGRGGAELRSRGSN